MIQRALAWWGRQASASEIIGPVVPAILGHEMSRMPRTQLLASHGPFDVVVASARQIPAVLLEIGRLRELSFRLVGEGTGRSFDLDRFDDHYEHLVLWNRERCEVAGAYRLARTDSVLRSCGRAGLYTASLFRLDDGFFRELGPAVELGRSFIRPEYQRKPHSLLLLWRGIGRYLERQPEYHTLFGPVSISARFGSAATEAMVTQLLRCSVNEPLRRHVRPRHRFRHATATGVRAAACVDVAERGLPVLLRHYLGLGGRVLEVSVDPRFGNCVDALIVVDLRGGNGRLLDRVLGRSSAATGVSEAGAVQLARN